MTKQEAKALRNSLGYTKQSLAAALGISISLVTKVETGERNVTAAYMAGLLKLQKKNKRKKPVDCGNHA